VVLSVGESAFICVTTGAVVRGCGTLPPDCAKDGVVLELVCPQNPTGWQHGVMEFTPCHHSFSYNKGGGASPAVHTVECLARCNRLASPLGWIAFV
jgi:hypothetical protein